VNETNRLVAVPCATICRSFLHNFGKVAMLALKPREFELIIDSTTAKALGLAIPEAFLMRADDLIE
jgi:hypothetical protein